MNIVFLGAGGHAKDIIKNLEEYNKSVSKRRRMKLIGCIDDQNTRKCPAEILGYPIFNSMDVFTRKAFKKVFVICAVGDPISKRIFIEKARRYHLRFINLIHPSVLIHRSTKIGSGVLIFSSSIISSCCCIGDYVTINYLCSINHDCSISSYSTLSPGVKLGGRLILEEGVLMGINACCSNDLRIGSWSVVGAGTTVIKDVPRQTIVVGNPHRILGKRKMESII